MYMDIHNVAVARLDMFGDATLASLLPRTIVLRYNIRTL